MRWLMLAMSYTGSSELVALRNGYSGRSMLAQTLTAHSLAVLPTQIAGVKHAHAPYCYRCDFGLTPDSCGMACAKDIENLIKYTTTGKIAAFGRADTGSWWLCRPPEGYLRLLSELFENTGTVYHG